MAKIVSPLIGQGKGKIGAQVLYRANGEQLIRARAIEVKNPQTAPQMNQRLMLANASKAAKGFGEIIDHSFETIKYGTESVRHFQSKAQAVLKNSHPSVSGTSQVTPAVPMDASGFPVAKFPVSEGSLVSAAIELVRNPASGVIGSFIATGGAATTAYDEMTCADFCELMGVNFGDQLTFIRTLAQVSDGAPEAEEFFNENRMLPIVRINFLATAENLYVFDSEGKFNEAVIDASRSNNWGVLTFSVANQQLSCDLDSECSGFALIVSRYQGGRWRRSSEILEIAALNGTQTGLQSTDVWGWNSYTSIEGLLTKTTTVVEDKFLNKEKNPQ